MGRDSMYPEDRPTREPSLPWIMDTRAGFLAKREAAAAWSKGSANDHVNIVPSGRANKRLIITIPSLMLESPGC